MAENVVELSDENFKKEISNGIVLVDFYAEWCGPCRVIAPIVETLAEKVQGKARVAKLDIDRARNAADELQINSIPTLILFKDGQEIKRVMGIKDLDFLLNLVNSYS